jgi:hypothetical protein
MIFDAMSRRPPPVFLSPSHSLLFIMYGVHGTLPAFVTARQHNDNQETRRDTHTHIYMHAFALSPGSAKPGDKSGWGKTKA